MSCLQKNPLNPPHLSLAQNQVRNLLRQHIYSTISVTAIQPSQHDLLTNRARRMPRRQERKRRSIHNPQSLDPNHPRLRVHYRRRIVPSPHSVRGRRMIDRVRIPPQILTDLRLCADIRARERFGANHNALQRPSAKDLPRTPESLHGEIQVARVAQQVGVHEGVGGGGGAVDGDGAAGEGREEHDGDGGVVLAVGGGVGEEVV